MRKRKWKLKWVQQLREREKKPYHSAVAQRISIGIGLTVDIHIQYNVLKAIAKIQQTFNFTFRLKFRCDECYVSICNITDLGSSLLIIMRLVTFFSFFRISFQWFWVFFMACYQFVCIKFLFYLLCFSFHPYLSLSLYLTFAFCFPLRLLFFHFTFFFFCS